jgi:hypothetical protein
VLGRSGADDANALAPRRFPPGQRTCANALQGGGLTPLAPRSAAKHLVGRVLDNRSMSIAQRLGRNRRETLLLGAPATRPDGPPSTCRRWAGSRRRVLHWQSQYRPLRPVGARTLQASEGCSARVVPAQRPQMGSHPARRSGRHQSTYWTAPRPISFPRRDEVDSQLQTQQPWVDRLSVASSRNRPLPPPQPTSRRPAPLRLQDPGAWQLGRRAPRPAPRPARASAPAHPAEARAAERGSPRPAHPPRRPEPLPGRPHGHHHPGEAGLDGRQHRRQGASHRPTRPSSPSPPSRTVATSS